MSSGDPPRLATWLLTVFLRDAERTEILGDLTEGFAIRSRQAGPRAARRWYRGQALGILLTTAREQLRLQRVRGHSLTDRHSRGDLLMHRRWMDIRYALRGFGRNMGFTATTISTLALGIGASTMVFAFVHAILLTPLPYPDPERVVGLWHAAPGLGLDRLPMSRGMYFVYGEHSRTLESVALYSPGRANVTVGQTPERLVVVGATHELFGILGGTPQVGRVLLAEDNAMDATPVAVLSHGLWTRGYGRDPDVLGRALLIDGQAHEVVGVVSAGFRMPGGDADVFVAAKPDPASPWTGGFNSPGVGRLADGVTPAEANADLASLFPILDERYANFSMESVAESQLRPDVHPVMDDVVGDVRPALWTLLATVGFVLLIACANVANLILIRTDARHREIALRRALGAHRRSVAAMFFTESSLLAGLGAAFGVGLAWAGTRLLARFGPHNIPRLSEVGIDPEVLAFATVLGVAAATLLGSIPLLRARDDGGIREEPRGSTTGRAAQRMRGVLVAMQTAFALMLLVASGLLVRSFWNLRHVDLGFTADNVLTFRISLPQSSYPAVADRSSFYRRLIEQIEAIPGVSAAGVTSRLPLDQNNLAQDPLFEPDRDDPNAVMPITGMLMASPDYFRTLDIPLIAGRSLTWADADGQTGALVVSAALANAYWPNGDAIGRRVRHSTAGPDTWSVVVGVIGDTHLRGITRPPGADVYYALQPRPGAGVEWLSNSMSVSVKTDVPPLTIAPAVREAVHALDPHIAASGLQPMASIVAAATAYAAFTMVVLGVAALVGLFLGAVGVYGVVAYVTGQRTREIGVRIALGASGSRVRQMVLRQGMIVTSLGVLTGVSASLVTTRLLRSQLYEVSAADPVTFGAVSGVVVLMSLAATYIPARRASRTDPMRALRAD